MKRFYIISSIDEWRNSNEWISKRVEKAFETKFSFEMFSQDANMPKGLEQRSKKEKFAILGLHSVEVCPNDNSSSSIISNAHAVRTKLLILSSSCHSRCISNASHSFVQMVSANQIEPDNSC